MPDLRRLRLTHQGYVYQLDPCESPLPFEAVDLLVALIALECPRPRVPAYRMPAADAPTEARIVAPVPGDRQSTADKALNEPDGTDAAGEKPHTTT